VRVVLYSRAGCHLCELAWEALLAERATIPFDLVEIDVAGDDELEERFEYEVDAAELASIVRGG
jgi:glutaredoxin